MSIKYRLLVYFLLFIILPTSVITITIYNRSVDSINRNIVRAVDTNINAASTNLLQRLEVAHEIATYLYLSPEFQQIISSKRPTDSNSFVREITAMDRLLDNYEFNYGSQISFVPKVYLYDRPEYSQINSSSRVGSITDIETEPWYMELPHQHTYNVVEMDKTGSHPVDSILLAKRLYALEKLHIDYVGLLTLEVKVDEFKARLNELMLTPHTQYMIINDNANIVFQAGGLGAGKDMSDVLGLNPYASDKGMFQANVNGMNTLISYKSIGQLPWKMIMTSPVSELDSELTSFKNSMTITLLLCMVIAFLLAWLLSSHIARPIKKFINFMSYAKEGNFNISVEYRRKDEFATMFNQYNQLLQKINGLIEKLYVSEIKKKEAELKALQAQINPHFLYNTLDSVNWMALRHGAKDVSMMVTYLSDFFRLSLHDGDSIVLLEDEMKQIQSYLAIQQLRFQDKLNYEIRLDESLRGIFLPKLIVQPIVENAIEHGISQVRDKGYIEVSACQEGDSLVIRVKDNGAGADMDMMKEILDSEQTSKQSFGLRNVNQRIKQFYGDCYGVEACENEDQPGLTVLLTLPSIRDKRYFEPSGR
ncbi:sensor histidine kinase [Paenibacillus swuensis]|nr:sensor histidine kinase [Paenibacillus swuensis]